jgi:hypothetical protein
MAGEFPHPDPFLAVRVHDIANAPGLTGLCAGYEASEWRCQQLADHLLEWIPEFALTNKEREDIGSHNAVALISKAARTVYTSPKYQKRGEVGELLLHVAMRQVFNTIPAIAKYYFKDAANDTVKGFDAVHVVASDMTLELWLGEVKFYSNVADAITDVAQELAKHTKADYLKAEFAAITNKIDGTWPYADRLRKLLHRNISLDEVFDSMCIPVFLTYDSLAVASHKMVTAAFDKAFSTEIRKHHAAFSTKLPKIQCKVHLFLLPLKSKADLVAAFDKGLKKWQ